MSNTEGEHFTPPLSRGISALRAHHTLALTVAMESFRTLTEDAEKKLRFKTAKETKDVADHLAQLAGILREELHAHIQRIHLRDRDAYHVIPESIRDGIDSYIRTGREPGGFLQAVLQGDLVRAIGSADNTNVWLLPQIVGYLLNTGGIPHGAWGSRLAYDRWLEWHNTAPQDEKDRLFRIMDGEIVGAGSIDEARRQTRLVNGDAAVDAVNRAALADEAFSGDELEREVDRLRASSQQLPTPEIHAIGYVGPGPGQLPTLDDEDPPVKEGDQEPSGSKDYPPRMRHDVTGKLVPDAPPSRTDTLLAMADRIAEAHGYERVDEKLVLPRDWHYRVTMHACPTCGAPPGYECKGYTSGWQDGQYVTRAHEARDVLAQNDRDAGRYEDWTPRRDDEADGLAIWSEPALGNSQPPFEGEGPHDVRDPLGPHAREDEASSADGEVTP